MPKPNYSTDPTHGSAKNRNSKYHSTKRSTTGIRWADVDGPSIKNAIDAVTADGCAVVFSRTSDGGALVLTLLDGPEKVKHYPNSNIEAVAILQDWALAAKGVKVD